MRNALLAAVLTLAAACNSPAEIDDKWADPATINYAPSLGIDLSAMTKSMSGLYSRDLVVGEGLTAGVGDEVTVRYTGWLPDGTEIGDHEQTFPLAEGLVLKGLDEGLLGMKVGGRRKLVIPPDLAYGRAGRGRSIPPLSTLIFEVDLLKVVR
ncbi:MAG TPA: FKBP-type peptidyl-prolyl cis-trans isomerase [Longimicrobiales bacterium]|nr:FKBP-type peptidyl-prolyl cis-trans isomerase [Longimicrobiales bacterium]